jgi:hypothetical protein
MSLHPDALVPDVDSWSPKPCKYLLLPHDGITENMTVDHLAKQYASPNGTPVNCLHHGLQPTQWVD